MTILAIGSDGAVSVVAALDGTEIIGINLDLYNHLGSDVQLQVSFTENKKTVSAAGDILFRTLWLDTLTGDSILDLSGTLSTGDDDTASYLNIAEATGEFETVSIEVKDGWLDAIKKSTGYNVYNSLGRKYASVIIADDFPPEFDADALISTIRTMDVPPALIALPTLSQLSVFTAAFRATKDINSQLIGEIDPTFTVAQAISLATSIDAQDHRVRFIYSPNKYRPRDAVSLSGKKQPAYALGQYVGNILLRNSRVSSQGIPLIKNPVAGYDYPFTYAGLERRTDVVIDSPELEQLAIAKINTVIAKRYSTGTRFVLNDVLTQYNSANSALRLANASEIATYTSNICMQILDRHLLKAKDSYIADASRDIDAFLSACSNSSVGLLVNSDELGGKPYSFSITEVPQYAFERVKLTLSRKPNGATRAAVFEDILTK